VLFGITGMDWRLQVCWLRVLRQVFVGLIHFGGGGLKIKRRMEVLKGYEWKMRMLWMLILGFLREILIKKELYSFMKSSYKIYSYTEAPLWRRLARKRSCIGGRGSSSLRLKRCNVLPWMRWCDHIAESVELI